MVVRSTDLAPDRALNALGYLAPSSSYSMMAIRDRNRPCLFVEDFFGDRSDLAARLVFERQSQVMVACNDRSSQHQVKNVLALVVVSLCWTKRWIADVSPQAILVAREVEEGEKVCLL
jgi:hypothetical protein